MGVQRFGHIMEECQRLRLSTNSVSISGVSEGGHHESALPDFDRALLTSLQLVHRVGRPHKPMGNRHPPPLKILKSSPSTSIQPTTSIVGNPTSMRLAHLQKSVVA